MKWHHISLPASFCALTALCGFSRARHCSCKGQTKNSARPRKVNGVSEPWRDITSHVTTCSSDQRDGEFLRQLIAVHGSVRPLCALCRRACWIGFGMRSTSGGRIGCRQRRPDVTANMFRSLMHFLNILKPLSKPLQHSPQRVNSAAPFCLFHIF